MNESKSKDLPSRKISETILDFAEPILGMIDDDTGEDQIRQGLIIAITIWNAKKSRS